MAIKKKINLLCLFLAFVFLAYAVRLAQLQVFQVKENRFLADNNRIAKQKVSAPRGLMKDRQGQILADNEPVYWLGDKSIDRTEALAIQAQTDSQLKIEPRRRYRQGSALAHVVGYLGEVSDKELKEEKLDLKGYFLGSLIGRDGLEAQYEDLLRGREGSELVEVDTSGQVIRRMGRILPVPGKILTLALARDLQETAARLLSKKGAIIATNPQNGEVLAFYSSPAYDPKILVKALQDEENRPLLNRVIAGLYPPGSTFKMVTAMAGLEEGKITAQTKFTDPGVIYYGSYKYANWYYTATGGTEGEITVVQALTRSTDTFFYKVGEWVGIDKLNLWAEKFGLTARTGIDLPGELPGFMATPDWKQKNKDEPWFLGNTYHLAIGQGDLDLTPLGVNMITSAVATGGKLCVPRMLKLGAENTPYQAECRAIGGKAGNWETVKRGMVGVCSAGGTAGSFSTLPFSTGCKTGTAETGDGKTTHAWFTVFAPVDDPQIALTVLVERGGEGSAVSAPIAKEILKEYFKKN